MWTGGRGDHGYGSLKDDDRRAISTHRFSWQLHHGAIPADMEVCHTCDNPPCVRPDHLFLGTHTDNMQDMLKKGRLVSAWGRRTACSAGHAYDEANTRVDRNGHRRCRACSREGDKRRRERKKSGAAR
ncbi:HNH endonuclease signature motif containing protein [Streptomyces vietnamensis]|uniref:HNH endonuclease signature motif containing protein n=1 Tax=Streptomyces vietnamensis TaxID=362257 RepID=UPI00341CA32B